MDEPTQDLSLIEVDLSSMEPKATNITPVQPPFLAVEPPCDIAADFNLHLQEALEWLQQDFPHNLSPHLST